MVVHPIVDELGWISAVSSYAFKIANVRVAVVTLAKLVFHFTI
jgi:hypothetical protein